MIDCRQEIDIGWRIVTLPHLSGCVFRLNGTVLLSVEGLRRWVDRQAAEAERAAETEADVILAALSEK